MDTKHDRLERLKMMATVFEGDAALFWAGRMSECVRDVMNSTPTGISERLWLLERCTDEYDNIIMKRT